MSRVFEFCLPTSAKAVPDGPNWFHEIKYDGYRLRVERSCRNVRLITKNGHNERPQLDRSISVHRAVRAA
ncbi:hypothetical protein SAMN05216330_12320 [Bradyrhizobium sp. Ghvi]|uniref:hypothetical protein n=1 Tax=Bradyrhizobium sp. Ghvi TaxID=1855319 RepID=UPI0008EC0D94|nr:hypothetical protein [Bradyrhizobium sp. Ghvi]SFQ28142.1 hypothetical protein SAMN05216330_12320 [Bradyrhizobium sp. Ghvi]